MEKVKKILLFIIGCIIAFYHPVYTKEFWIISMPIVLLASIGELKC